jgi:hypothetical protein
VQCQQLSYCPFAPVSYTGQIAGDAAVIFRTHASESVIHHLPAEEFLQPPREKDIPLEFEMLPRE